MTEQQNVAVQPDAVRAWLAQFPPDQLCATAGDYHACPLARYLNHVTGARDAYVTDSIYRVGGQIFDTPEWACAFIDHVDMYAVHQGDDNLPRTITARTALALLQDALTIGPLE